MKNRLIYSKARTVEKAFYLLEMISEFQSLTPSEITKKSGFTRSNVHRLLRTLFTLGYIDEDSNSRYRLSYKLFILGNSLPEKGHLIDTVRPFMKNLAEKTKENINLAVFHENRVLYIDKIESPHSLKLDQRVGATDPVHCTALGKALLSGSSESELKSFLDNESLDRYTRNTITSKEDLVRVIQSVRVDGYAIDNEELNEGIRCLGCPIFNSTGKVVAALSISSPSLRFPETKMKEYKNIIIQDALEISLKLGFAKNQKGRDL